MASSRYLITSTTLSSSAASVTFSSIPSTYTDLVLKCSGRLDASSGFIKLNFNSDSGSNYSTISIKGNGSAAGSEGEYPNATRAIPNVYPNWNTLTSNTFDSMEIYIPSYTASQSKPFSSFAAQETNATTAYISASAMLYRSNTAISSIVLAPNSANFVSGSTFTLYGLKNS